MSFGGLRGQWHLAAYWASEHPRLKHYALHAKDLGPEFVAHGYGLRTKGALCPDTVGIEGFGPCGLND